MGKDFGKIWYEVLKQCVKMSLEVLQNHFAIRLLSFKQFKSYPIIHILKMISWC